MSLFSERVNFRPFEYPQAYEFVKTHIENPWHEGQIDVSGDVQDYKTEFTESEKHGITAILKIFTQYEVNVGSYWIDTIYKHFKPYEIRMMAQTFAHTEYAIHAVFYDKLNDALGLSNKEFYLSFQQDPIMNNRMKSIQRAIACDTVDDLPISLATFSFIEGVVLYSSFAYLLSFTKRGKLTNVSNGIAWTVKEEAQHSSAGSWLFNTLIGELGHSVDQYADRIYEVIDNLVSVEMAIVDDIFSKGPIKDITDKQLKNFVMSRADKKLKDIGLKPKYNITYNPVADWFYKKTSGIEFSDFFATNASSYTHDWNFTKIKGW